jgi:predicted membrane chloride channel (bestrophin family)
MSRASDPLFRTFDLPLTTVEQHLTDLQGREWTQFREARQLWQLTPAGREQHRSALTDDVADAAILDELRDSYAAFLAINERFKMLCGEWQLRDGAPNDHNDAAYDRAVVAKLVALQNEALPVVEAMGQVLERLQPYANRLVASCQRVVAGETNMFTGVMCGSYHDVWMELHEDLILTQGIDRTAEGSF